MRAKVPNNVEVVGSLGLAYLGKKEPDKALAAFQEVLKLQPGNTPALVNVARIQQQQGKKKEEILQLVRDQITAAPDSAGNLMLLATMLMTEKQYDEALGLTRKVQELQPQMTSAYTLGAEIYKRLDKTDEAVGEYNKLLTSGSNKLQAYMGLGAIHEQRGERDLAKKQYQEVLKISPNFAPAANNLAWIMIEDEQPDLGEALRLALTAKQALPEDAHIVDTLGMVHYKRGSFGLARAEFAQAVEHRPDMPVFQYHLAMALYGDGQKDEAMKELGEALAKEQPFNERAEAEALLKKWQAEAGQ